MTHTSKIANRVYDRYAGKLPQMPYRPYIRVAVRRPWPGIFAGWRSVWRFVVPALLFWLVIAAAVYEVWKW